MTMTNDKKARIAHIRAEQSAERAWFAAIDAASEANAHDALRRIMRPANDPRLARLVVARAYATGYVRDAINAAIDAHHTAIDAGIAAGLAPDHYWGGY